MGALGGVGIPDTSRHLAMLGSSVPGIEPTYLRHLCSSKLQHFGIELGFHDTFSTFRFSGIEIVRNRADTFSTFRFSSIGIEESRNRALDSLPVGPGTQLGTEN